VKSALVDKKTSFVQSVVRLLTLCGAQGDLWVAAESGPVWQITLLSSCVVQDHLQALAATYKIRGLSAGGADAESPVPPAKLHETARRPAADAAAASGGKRRPFAALSTSDRNARRNSSIL